MAMLIDQIDSSGLFAQSAYSASIATHDSVGNDITATYEPKLNTGKITYINLNDETALSSINSSSFAASYLVPNAKYASNGTQPAVMTLNPLTTPFNTITGICKPLQYATGAVITFGSSGTDKISQYYGGFFKGNELYISQYSGASAALRMETHNNRGVHISGVNEGNNNNLRGWFDLSPSGLILSSKNHSALFDTAYFNKWNEISSYENNSAVFNAKQDALTFGYDTNNAISSINSSAITTTPSQKLYLQSPLTTGVSAGSAYIGIEPSSTYNETVLWSGTKTSAIQTSESMKNFEKCQVYIAHGTYGPPQVYTIDFADMETTGYFAITRPRGSVNLNIACIKLTADDTHLATVNSKCLTFGSWSTTATGITATTGEAEDLNSIIKVVGINRKENS